MQGTLFLDPLKTATYYYDRKDSLDSPEKISLRAQTQSITKLKWILKKGPLGCQRGTLWTLLASWFRDQQTHLLALSSSATRTCPGKRQRENAGKIIEELWEIPPADLENQDTLPFCKKKFGLVQITANLFARFCTKPSVFFLCGLWLQFPSLAFCPLLVVAELLLL